MNRAAADTVRTEREALARVKDLHPQPRLVVQERPELRFVSIGFPGGGSVQFPVLGFYAVSMQLGGTAYLREESWRRGHVRAPAGSVFVQTVNSAVEYAWRARHVSWALCLESCEVEAAARETGALNPQRIEIVSRSGQDEAAAHMVRALAAQAAAGSHPGQQLACSALRKAMALHMLAHYGVFPSAQRLGARRLSPAKLKRGIAYLEENLGRDCTLEELAAETGVSRFVVSEQFRRATGETPAAYVDRVRVERAQRLLRQSRMDPEELGRSLGFADLPSFASVFLRVSGVSLERFLLQRGTSRGSLPPASEKPS